MSDPLHGIPRRSDRIAREPHLVWPKVIPAEHRVGLALFVRFKMHGDPELAIQCLGLDQEQGKKALRALSKLFGGPLLRGDRVTPLGQAVYQPALRWYLRTRPGPMEGLFIERMLGWCLHGMDRWAKMARRAHRIKLRVFPGLRRR